MFALVRMKAPPDGLRNPHRDAQACQPERRCQSRLPPQPKTAKDSPRAVQTDFTKTEQGRELIPSPVGFPLQRRLLVSVPAETNEGRRRVVEPLFSRTR